MAKGNATHTAARERHASALLLGAYLCAERKAAGLTRAELARRAGMFKANLSRIESGRALPTLETLSRLADACGARLRIWFVPIGELPNAAPPGAPAASTPPSPVCGPARRAS